MLVNHHTFPLPKTSNTFLHSGIIPARFANDRGFAEVMDDFCSVYSAILASLDSEYSEWYKSICACKLYTNRSFRMKN